MEKKTQNEYEEPEIVDEKSGLSRAGAKAGEYATQKAADQMFGTAKKVVIVTLLYGFLVVAAAIGILAFIVWALFSLLPDVLAAIILAVIIMPFIIVVYIAVSTISMLVGKNKL